LRVFCINLDHRTDRWQYMEAQFAALGMTVERIRATTPGEISAADLAPLAIEDVRKGLMPTEIATSISHHRAWRRMLEEGDPFVLILEDDAELSPRLPGFLAAVEERGGLPGVIRLETRQKKQVLARRIAYDVCGFQLHHPLTWEWGTAAYIITAEEARSILASPRRFEMPIDDTIQNPASPLYRPDRVLQTVPALVFVPDEDVSGGSQPASIRQSDTQTERTLRFRADKERMSRNKFLRELLRIQRQFASIGTRLRHRMLGRMIAVPFADEAAISARSSAVPPPG
jgi:glycosyl transferase family 25